MNEEKYRQDILELQKQRDEALNSFENLIILHNQEEKMRDEALKKLDKILEIFHNNSS